MLRALPPLLCWLWLVVPPLAQEKQLPRPGAVFLLDGRTAFVIEPSAEARLPGPQPWVWYAPTLPRLPGAAETWMFDQWLAQGIAIAGIDVGESYGSPDGRAHFQRLYEHLTGERDYAPRPVLLARSRGGLMLYNWAAEHPRSVAGVVGVYPVCNLESYPGLERAAPAYRTSAARLAAALGAQNPLLRLGGLARAGVPLLHIHGDSDRVVPLEANSAALAQRYRALGGEAEVLVVEGGGHDMNPVWFQSQALVDFGIERALAGREPLPAPQPGALRVVVLLNSSEAWGRAAVEDESRWPAREDVLHWVPSAEPGPHPLRAQAAGVGVELGLGRALGDAWEAPVLLLETQRGRGRMGWELLPPGSERYEAEGRTWAGYGDTPRSWVEGESVSPADGYAGEEYDALLRELRSALGALESQSTGRPQLAGIVAWPQAHRREQADADLLERQLRQWVSALRADLEAPRAAFVLVEEQPLEEESDAELELGARALRAALERVDAVTGVSVLRLQRGPAPTAENLLGVGEALGRAMRDSVRESR